MVDWSAVATAAAATNPMSAAASGPILHGLVLRVDGDGIAYYCAGNDDTPPQRARDRAEQLIQSAKRACGAEKVQILLTGSGSHKGHRYAVARVKPYQGQRQGSRRPKNWSYLRAALEANVFGPAVIDYDREADDRFGQAGHADPEHSVHYTQDKDMRMVPGYHLDWQTFNLIYIPAGTYDYEHNGLQYGRKWFWTQMLQGDPADFIPGVPKAYGKLCGPVTAVSMLAGTTCNDEAFEVVAAAYQSCYGEDWRVNLLEQAVLLWMRNDPLALWDNVFEQGNPLGMVEGVAWFLARKLILQRITEAQELSGTLPTQGE